MPVRTGKKAAHLPISWRSSCGWHLDLIAAENQGASGRSTGWRIASPKPTSGATSGLRIDSRSPVASAAAVAGGSEGSVDAVADQACIRCQLFDDLWRAVGGVVPLLGRAI